MYTLPFHMGNGVVEIVPYRSKTSGYDFETKKGSYIIHNHVRRHTRLGLSTPWGMQQRHTRLGLSAPEGAWRMTNEHTFTKAYTSKPEHAVRHATKAYMSRPEPAGRRVKNNERTRGTRAKTRGRAWKKILDSLANHHLASQDLTPLSESTPPSWLVTESTLTTNVCHRNKRLWSRLLSLVHLRTTLRSSHTNLPS